MSAIDPIWGDPVMLAAASIVQAGLEPEPERGPFYIANRRGQIYYYTLFDSRKAAVQYLNQNHDEFNYWRGVYGDDVAKALQRLNLQIKTCDTWTERENLRFSCSVYSYPVWSSQPWWLHRSHDLVEHFAHVSTDDPGAIAFTPDAKKGERDIQTRMKAGRYLNKFFGPDSDNPVLTPKQIAFFAEWQQSGKKPHLDIWKDAELHFARTPDEIVAAYEQGPSSCMSGKTCVRVYGAGDLAVAYLKKGGEIIARALCWPERKALGRVYPTPDGWEDNDDIYSSHEEAEAAQMELSNRLLNDGYVSAYADTTVFNGARLLAERYGNGDSNSWVMPYLDNFRLSMEIEDGCFIAEKGGYWSSDGTNGIMYGPEGDDEDVDLDAEDDAEDFDDEGPYVSRSGDTFTIDDVWTANTRSPWFITAQEERDNYLSGRVHGCHCGYCSRERINFLATRGPRTPNPQHAAPEPAAVEF